MRKITSVSISDELDGFLKRMVESGRYGSISEVMRSALRLLEQTEAQNEATRQAVLAGLESGESTLTIRDIVNQCKQKHNV